VKTPCYLRAVKRTLGVHRSRGTTVRWVLVAVNAVFVWWIMSAANELLSECDGLAGGALEACENQATMAVGVSTIGFLFVALIVNGLIFLVWRMVRMSAPSER
jgi:hypothetical protein